MINKFAQLPETQQGLRLFILHAAKQIKTNIRLNKKLEELIQEANNRIIKQGESNGKQIA